MVRMKNFNYHLLHFNGIDPIHFLRVIGILILISAFASYLLFQARNFLEGPHVEVYLPPHSIHSERAILVEGSTKNTTEITLNGLPIFTDDRGMFKHTLVLENGYTIMTIRAEDRFGRETTLTRTFVYQPTS
jgi:hypothetical protein